MVLIEYLHDRKIHSRQRHAGTIRVANPTIPNWCGREAAPAGDVITGVEFAVEGSTPLQSKQNDPRTA